MTCVACGATADEGARFCPNCGRPLRNVGDERRVVTVLFGDLVGYTRLAERMDPEQVKNLVDRCFDRLAGVITSFGGQVDKVVGDAIVALFGAPTAHEDDAERAVRAALRMQEVLAGGVPGTDRLRMRIGVNTGEVLVGAMRAAGSVTAMGDVVNTAARMQTSAEPGEVLVGPATHAATRRVIAYEARGRIDARGRDQSVETWRALAPTLPPGHRTRRVDVPLLGRDHEVGLLRQAAQSSIANRRALLVVLVGDVGLGKTRLADAVTTWAVQAHGASLREGRCVPYGEANVWWPVADALRDGLGVHESDDRATATTSVRRQVAAIAGGDVEDPEVVRTAQGLLTLLGYDPPERADPIVVREEAGRALARHATAMTRRAPLALQLSDLHWADQAVLDLVDDVMALVGREPVMVIATARPALLDRWSPRPGRHNTLVLHLDPLSRTAAAELLHTLAGEQVPEPVVDALLDRSGGNPFFIEELVSVLEGSPAVADADRLTALPDTLRGLVAARLDDMAPEARAVLQDAAVIGHRGPISGLVEMGRKLGRAVGVDAALSALVDEEVMEVDGDEWAFRSDLIREVAYQTITKTDRALRHLGIATYLEEVVGAREHRPAWLVDQLAHHLGSATSLASELGTVGGLAGFPPDLAVRARRWIVEAAERARRDRALPTAVRLYGEALDLLPADDVRSEEAAALPLARAQVAAETWDLATARADLDRACDYADATGDLVAAAQALVVRGGIEQKEGDLDAAAATLTAAVERFEELGDRAGTADALRNRAMVEIFAGQIPEAEASASAALTGFREVGDAAGEAWSLQNLGWTAFVTGRSDHAEERVREAVQRFDEIGDTRGLAWSRGLLAWVRFQEGRVAEAEELGDAVLEEARSRVDPWATPMMVMLQASLRLWRGRTEEAVELARDALARFESLADGYGEVQAAAVLGRALVMAGRVEEGFAVLDRVTRATADRPRSAALAAYTRLVVAVQVGEPDRAGDVRDVVATLGPVGGEDPAVTLGMAALQLGEVDEAVARLGGARQGRLEPRRIAARALLSVATGDGFATELLQRLETDPTATYLDRALGEVAGAMEAARGNRADSALAHVAAARSHVADTGDRVAIAVVELAAGRVAQRVGDPEAPDVTSRARWLLDLLGISATGWMRVFDRAAGPDVVIDATGGGEGGTGPADAGGGDGDGGPDAELARPGPGAGRRDG